MVAKQTRPTLERRETLGHLRSINRNMITHFANQSDLPTSEKLNNIPVRCIFPSHFLFFVKIPVRCIFPGHFHSFLLHSHSVSLYTGFFLPICISLCCIVVHKPWILEVIWHTFSILHCFVASFPSTLQTFYYTYLWLTPVHCDNLYIFSWPCQLNLSVTVNIHQQLPVPLKTRSENQRLQISTRLSTPIRHVRPIKIIIHYMYIYTRYARFFNAFVALSFLLRTLSSLCRCMSLFFSTFGMACQ